jgi:ABC-type antimicrobial peptide transport system permease subunit
MGETFLYALISLNFAVILASLFMPVLNNLTLKEIRLNYLEPSWIGILFAIWLFTSFSAGSYPALLLASKIPSSIFQQQQQAWSGRSITRTILVTSQFVFATIFLITVIVVNRQFYYMDHEDLGYKKQDLVYLRLRDQPRDMSEVIKNDLLQIPGITAISNTSHLPVLIAGGFYEEWGRSDEKARYLASTSVDYDYLRTMGLEMKEGRFYSREFSTDSINAVVLNEKALEQMGLESGIGERFFYRGKNYNIIGVMKDFHHVPLLLKITPLLFRLQPAGNDYILLRIGSSDAADMSRILEQITSTWKQNFPELPLEYNFLEDYEFPQERVIYSAVRLMRYFTILSILISSMGLYGLSTFMAERKTKEIGIRKVVGATIGRIIRIFSREYLKLIVLANLIAWPLAWLLLKLFLDAFAYRTKISPWIFLVVGIFVCILAIITVGVQAYRSALRNPADTLRYE